MSKTISNKRSGKTAELLNDCAGAMPVWIRPPKRGTEFYSGLSRPKLYQLAAEGKIVTRSLREPGQIKGTRLFLLASILSLIEGSPEATAHHPMAVAAGAT
jgi:hypothetical protein